MSTKHTHPTPNDQRSDVKNPNNPAHKEAQDNRSRQLDPKNPQNAPPPVTPQDPPPKKT